MKHLICCVFLFSYQLFFSQNIENKTFGVSNGYTSLKVRFERENEATFVSSYCLGSDVSKGKYFIKNDTIYCEYSPFVNNFSKDSIFSPEQLKDSIEFQFTFHSIETEDTCLFYLIDSTTNYIQKITFPRNAKSSIKIPRNLNQLSFLVYNTYYHKEINFTSEYIKLKTHSNSLELETIYYSNSVFYTFQKYYFDPNDNSIIWLKNSSKDIKMHSY